MKLSETQKIKFFYKPKISTLDAPYLARRTLSDVKNDPPAREYAEFNHINHRALVDIVGTGVKLADCAYGEDLGKCHSNKALVYI